MELKQINMIAKLCTLKVGLQITHFKIFNQNRKSFSIYCVGLHQQSTRKTAFSWIAKRFYIWYKTFAWLELYKPRECNMVTDVFSKHAPSKSFIDGYEMFHQPFSHLLLPFYKVQVIKTNKKFLVVKYFCLIYAIYFWSRGKS